MSRIPFAQQPQEPEQASPPESEQTRTVSTLDAIHVLRSAGDALFDQAMLYVKLLHVEWAEEKKRLLTMFIVMLLGFVCLLCLMIFAGGLVLALSWDTEYRISTLIALMTLYGAGTVLAGFYIQSLAARSSHAFLATREEFAADMALLKSRL